VVRIHLMLRPILFQKERVMNNGGGFIVGLLGVAFVVLKLLKVIDWSWWYVLLPFYGAIALITFVWIIGFLFVVVGSMIKAILKKRRER
jgi:hypothetical protein